MAGALAGNATSVLGQVTFEVSESDHDLGPPTGSPGGRRPRKSGSLKAMEPLVLTVICEPVDGGWVQARIEELPAVITAGATEDQAMELVADALREYLASLGPEAPVEAGRGAWRRRMCLVIDMEPSLERG